MKEITENSWERQADESVRDYEYFRMYLLSTPRSLEKLAETIQKSASRIRGIAAAHDWRGRAAAYDASIMEEARQAIRHELPAVIMRQWRDSAEIAARAAAELRTRDMARASFKSLNEIYATFSLQLQKLAETLKVMEDTGDKNLTIKIVRAE